MELLSFVAKNTHHESGSMQPKRYIVWSKRNLDLSDPWQRRWYIPQVLSYGRTEDIAGWIGRKSNGSFRN